MEGRAVAVWASQQRSTARMTFSTEAASRRLSFQSLPRRGLFLLIGAAVAAILVVFAVVLVGARDDARRTAGEAEMNLATALARDMDRSVELLNLSIEAARDAWSDPRVRALDPALRQMVVFDHSATARSIDAILIVDRDGEVVADSRSVTPQRDSFRDADFFTAQQARDVGLVVGPPMRMPGKPGWHIAFSHRITAQDGSFGGVSVGFLNLADLSETYRRLPLGPGGALLLFNVDGTLLMREPVVRGLVGRTFKGSAVFDRMAGTDGGSFEAASSLDARRRLFAYRRVGSLPLIQGVAATTDEVYAGWRMKAAVLAVVMAILCSGILALLVGLKRELQQRVAAERALDVLASTDPLTGLANRRKFFERAEVCCAEAVRDGRALSVLMIDADHFKSFNDRYGHAAGDRVLVAIGRAIADGTRVDIDLAARYGGEEFIVLLPGLDRVQAFAVAETVRAAVARLAEPHERAPAGFVTVSIGVASAEAGRTPDLRALVEAADGELYRSKRDGRNRSSGGERLAARQPRLEPVTA